jgi:type I restriction enzyme S subunit
MKPQYKQTEVGVIPEDWEVKSLGELSEFITSGSRGWAEYYSETGALFIRSQNVRDGSLNFEETQYVRPPSGAEGNRTKVKRNDLLITITGNSVGNVALVEHDYSEAYISQHVGLVRLSKPEMGSYACRFLSPNSPGNKQIAGSQSGQSKPGLNLQNLKDFQIALPPTLPEQRAIATALSDVDALLAALDRLIAKKRDLKQAAMQQLLTGQIRLPGFKGEWEVKRLGELATFFKGKGLPKSALSESGTAPCIHYGELFTRYPETIGEIFSRTDTSEGVFLSVANDVLMPTSDVTPRGLAKASCVRVDGVILGGDILVIRSDRTLVHGPFLSLVIRYEETQVLQLVTGSTVYHLYGSDMKNFVFSMPSLPEQTAIASALTEMDGELAALEQRREKTRALKQAMMQELLTGKTRLI